MVWPARRQCRRHPGKQTLGASDFQSTWKEAVQLFRPHHPYVLGTGHPNMEDDDNPKFVLFIRTLNVPRWYALSVVTGGTTAKVMVGAMKNDWGKKLYEGTLTRNIAGVIYKDERAVRQTAIKQYPVLKSAAGFQYGYKIMDPANPKSALFASDVVVIPPQEELNSIVDKVKDFFGKIGESFGSQGSLPASSQEGNPNGKSKNNK